MVGLLLIAIMCPEAASLPLSAELQDYQSLSPRHSTTAAFEGSEIEREELALEKHKLAIAEQRLAIEEMELKIVKANRHTAGVQVAPRF